VRPVGGSPPAFDGGSGPLMSVGFRVRPPGRARLSSFGRSKPRRDLIGSWSEQSERDIAVVGRTRGQVPVANLKRVGRVLGPGRLGRWESPGVPRVLLLREASRGKHTREWVGKLALRRASRALERRRETQESIDPVGLRPVRARTLSKSKPLEPRGIVAFWSSEQKSAMSETA
jgi:hypothetical protein